MVNRRDLVLWAAEAADGWQFIPANQLVKAPGLTEPLSPIRMGPVPLSGLADQLIFQIDMSENATYHSDMDGRCTVVNTAPKDDQPSRTSFHGETRAINALNAIYQSKILR